MSRKAVLQKKCQQYVDGAPEEDGVVVIRKVSFTLVETKAKFGAKFGGLPPMDLLHCHTPEELLLLVEEDPEEASDCVMEFLSTLGMTAPVVVERSARSKKSKVKPKGKKK